MRRELWLACVLLSAPSGLSAEAPKLRVTLSVPGDYASSVAFSPDGKTFASGDWDGTVALWAAADGKRIATLNAHADTVLCVAFSPNGRTLAAGDVDASVRLWDLKTGKNAATLTGHGRSVTSVAFSPDGKVLASASGGTDENRIRTRPGEVKLWDVATGMNTFAFTWPRNYVCSVAFSPDGGTLAAGGGKVFPPGGYQDEPLSVGSPMYYHRAQKAWYWQGPKTIKLWDVVTGSSIATLDGGQVGHAGCVAFSRDGKVLASGSADGTVILWNMATRQGVATLDDWAGGRSVYLLAFSPDGKTLAAGCHDGITLWDLGSRKSSGRLKGHACSVLSVAFSPDGKTLASASADGTVKLWDVIPAAKK